MSTAFPHAKEADIALILEGTYPFVSGGVSSWVNQMIRAFPEYRFAAVFIGGRPQDYGEMKYVLPANVVHLEVHYLHGGHTLPPIKASSIQPKLFKTVTAMHETLQQRGKNMEPTRLIAHLREVLDPRKGIQEQQFLYSEEAWQYLSDTYYDRCSDPSFVDYFWTVRMMHQPIWILAKIANTLIPVKAIHTISTGYAGFLATLLKQRTNCPVILSEHGLYTKERKIDLFQNQWVRDNRDFFQKTASEISYYRELWIRFFESLGQMCYLSADIITALYETIRQHQIVAGAPPERTHSIPNGIDLQRFLPARAKRPATPPPVLCLIGRVVPIKDIKTYIRAMRIIINRIPEAEGWIAGPEDEDLEYAEECHNLVASLGLEERVKFLGFRKVEEILPDIGLLVLSSISEALPLVLLEGYAAGVPAVTTDVGSCRQLIFGSGEQDEQLGPSGDVVRIADPEGLANAALALLTDNARYYAACQAAIQRVEKFWVCPTRLTRSFHNSLYFLYIVNLYSLILPNRLRKTYAFMNTLMRG